MPVAPWKLVQAFIREATENADYSLIADMGIAYARLRTIQKGHFTAATAPDASGLVQLKSTVGATSFEFAVPASLSQAEIIAMAETALQAIEGKTVAEARDLLRPVKRARADFRTFQL